MTPSATNNLYHLLSNLNLLIPQIKENNWRLSSPESSQLLYNMGLHLHAMAWNSIEFPISICERAYGLAHDAFADYRLIGCIGRSLYHSLVAIRKLCQDIINPLYLFSLLVI